ncbi:hypothetical protein [Streptomyces sp. NPDC003393]
MTRRYADVPATPGDVPPELPVFLWRNPDPRPSYDVVVVGAGGHGLATAESPRV